MSTNTPEPLEITDSRIDRAMTDFLAVKQAIPGTYVVYSNSGEKYIVEMDSQTCTCPDHEERRVWCKHMLRVVIETGKGIPGTCHECALLPDDFPCADCYIRWGKTFAEAVE